MQKVLIENTDGYYVREDGAVFGKKGILKPVLNKHGYLCVSVKFLDRGFLTVRVHRLVAKAFITNPENKPEVNHIDGVKTNNHVSNLEWATSKENQIHANKVLKRQVGESHPHVKITESQVHEVCKLMNEGYQNHDISRITGVSRDTVIKIRERTVWTFITEHYNFPAKSRSLSVETVEWVCRKFEEGYTSTQIRDMSTNPKLTLPVIKGIKGRRNYKWISAKFNF